MTSPNEMTLATLSGVHSNLFNDLNEIARLARKQGSNVDGATMLALNHLRELEALIDPTPNLEFRKAQIEGRYSEIDVIDLLMDRLEGAEAICDMLAVVAKADEGYPGCELCDTTMHRAAFTARNLVTECLEKTKTWNAQHSSRGES